MAPSFSLSAFGDDLEGTAHTLFLSFCDTASSASYVTTLLIAEILFDIIKIIIHFILMKK
jgi:hypothetical protein